MATKKNENVLTSEFLAELYNAAITNTKICSAVTQYMKESFLPDAQYQMLNNTLKGYFNEFKSAPNWGVITQKLSVSRATLELLEEIKETSKNTDPAGILDSFESYLKQIQFKSLMKELNKKYESGERIDAMSYLIDKATELRNFTLKSSDLVDIAATFEERLRENKQKAANPDGDVVNSWHIPQLDAINRGSDLRGQLSCILACTGVGKSFFGRYIGYMSAFVSGLNVLHFSLEMSESEVVNAYSGMLNNMGSWEFERGMINDHSLNSLREKLKTFQGTLKVKAYTKFAKEPTTRDLWNEIEKYKEINGCYPSVVIVDSGDLLGDASGKNWGSKELRLKLISVYRDLKDIATNANCWVVSLYQSTVENQEFLNDESKYLTTFQISESKGISRPVSHLISLNQSRREYGEEVMRLNVEKYRGAKKIAPFRIACDYSHGFFYDSVRSLNMVDN